MLRCTIYMKLEDIRSRVVAHDIKIDFSFSYFRQIQIRIQDTLFTIEGTCYNFPNSNLLVQPVFHTY